jgi:hypothetical protein
MRQLCLDKVRDDKDHLRVTFENCVSSRAEKRCRRWSTFLSRRYVVDSEKTAFVIGSIKIHEEVPGSPLL